MQYHGGIDNTNKIQKNYTISKERESESRIQMGDVEFQCIHTTGWSVRRERELPVGKWW